MLLTLDPPCPPYACVGEVRALESKQAASNEAALSLQNKNTLLKGGFFILVSYSVDLSIHIGKLAETQTTQPHHHAQARTRKKQLIRRPKGSGWPLQDAMGLANDETKYKRVVVRASLHATHLADP